MQRYLTDTLPESRSPSLPGNQSYSKYNRLNPIIKLGQGLVLGARAVKWGFWRRGFKDKGLLLGRALEGGVAMHVVW